MKNNENENDAYAEIGRRLSEFRKLCNFTQSDVEKSLGIKQETISMIESGNRKISAVMLKQLCQLYGVTYEQVIGKLEIKSNFEPVGSKNIYEPVKSIELLKCICKNADSEDLNNTISMYVDIWVYCLVREIYESNPKNTDKIFSMKKEEAVKCVMNCLEKAPSQLSSFIKSSSGKIKSNLIEPPLEQAADFREFIKYIENIISDYLIK